MIEKTKKYSIQSKTVKGMFVITINFFILVKH